MELVILEVAAPQEPPETLVESMTHGAIAELDAVIEEARKGILEEATSNEAVSRDEFVGLYARHQGSAIATLLGTPELARAEDLVRSVELNPRDVQFPTEAIERLDRLVTAYRDVIAKAVDLRDLESHHLTIVRASNEGLIPVEPNLERIPTKAIEEFRNSALAKDPTEGPEYERILLAYEARYLQELLRADVLLVHGNGAYLAPEGSVLTELVHYKNFVSEQTVAMIYDVLEFFSRYGALDEEQLDQLLSGLDGVIEAAPR
ncbi:MAG: hypothetical protein AAF368_03670 [Planctomycetota bacterium]